jgi:hypothetical protein
MQGYVGPRRVSSIAKDPAAAASEHTVDWQANPTGFVGSGGGYYRWMTDRAAVQASPRCPD